MSLLEQARHQSALLLEQREREVLHVHGLVLVARGDGLRLRQGRLRFLGEFVQVHRLRFPAFVNPLEPNQGKRNWQIKRF